MKGADKGLFSRSGVCVDPVRQAPTHVHGVEHPFDGALGLGQQVQHELRELHRALVPHALVLDDDACRVMNDRSIGDWGVFSYDDAGRPRQSAQSSPKPPTVLVEDQVGGEARVRLEVPDDHVHLAGLHLPRCLFGGVGVGVG